MVDGAAVEAGEPDLDATLEKVTDYLSIVGYGVMSTPALVVEEKLGFSGRGIALRMVGC